MADLCPGCVPRWLAWTDYRPPVTVPLCTPGMTTVRDVIDARRHREEDRRALIRRQQAHLLELCLANHQQEPS